MALINFSGVFIVADNQYRVGDVVSIHMSVGGSVEGTILRITLRTTVLRDDEGAIHFIPNGNIARAANQTLDYANVNIELSLPLGANFDEAAKQINSLGHKMSQEDSWKNHLLQAPYWHGVQTMDKDGVIIEVRAKTTPTNQWEISSELQKRIAVLVHENVFFEKKDKSKSAKTD